MGYTTQTVAHTVRDKTKLLNRIRRIRGQVEAVERALDEEQECAGLLQTLAACRGAINGLMSEVIEGHIRSHVLDPTRKPTPAQEEASGQLIDIIRAYLR